MRLKCSAIAEKFSARHVQDEVSRFLKRLADPATADDRTKQLIWRASQRVGLPYGATKRLWYREVQDIPAHIYEHIKQKATAHDIRLQQAMSQALHAMQESDQRYFASCIEALRAHLPDDGDEASGGQPEAGAP